MNSARPVHLAASLTPETPEFLSGGGEMGARMRDHDWSHSSLGPPAQWPQSLRTVVRLMLNTGHPMYIWWGAELACLYNDAYRESIGPERHPGSLGRPAREVWDEIWPIIGPQIEQVMSGRGATWNENHLVPITRHGRREDVYWTYSYSPIDDHIAPGGIGGVLVVCNETTQQVLAARQLTTERERLGMALAAGQMGAFEMDLAANTLWWSPQMYPLFGVDRAHFVVTPLSVLTLLHPDDSHEFLRVRRQAIERREPFVFEFRVQRPDGMPGWLHIWGHANYGDDGKALRTFGVMMDITARKRLEQVLREADRNKDDFIAILAHELRNPLAPIRNAISMLRQVGLGSDIAARCHDVLERQVSQMARLLDDLLDVSRLSRGQLRLRRERISLNAAIEQAIETAQPVIDAGGHTLAVTLPPRTLVLEGDLMRLAQVFSNVLINAAKYTPPGGRITLQAQAQGSQAVVRVADTGIGIAAEDVAQIFEIFGQAKAGSDRAQGGQGIGLSLAKGLVEMHGGTIEARSEGVDRGSEFVIQLPLSAGAALPVESLAAGTGPAAVQRNRILIADDLQDAADTMALLLQTMGHEVSVAYDGEHALQLAESMRPDVALLDLGMPKLDGYTVARRIRAAPWGARVMLVAQTGWGQDRDRQQTRDAGFDHHVVKPVDIDELLALLPRRA